MQTLDFLSLRVSPGTELKCKLETVNITQLYKSAANFAYSAYPNTTGKGLSTAPMPCLIKRCCAPPVTFTEGARPVEASEECEIWSTFAVLTL